MHYLQHINFGTLKMALPDTKTIQNERTFCDNKKKVLNNIKTTDVNPNDNVFFPRIKNKRLNSITKKINRSLNF